MKRLLIFIFIFSAFNAYAGEITVGSFNIEWFGSGNAPRTDEQIEKLGNYIKSLEIDILCCQEINSTGDRSGNGVADWIDLKNYLGDEYEGWYGNTGRQQRLAFIWRKDTVELSDIGELNGGERESVPGVSVKTFPRRPLTAYVKSQKGGLDFRIITVHLYWSVDKVRYAEAKKLNEWAANYLNGQNDKDLIVIGDCNTKPMGSGESQNSQTIINFEKNSILTAVSKAHYKYTTPESEERYDMLF